MLSLPLIQLPQAFNKSESSIHICTETKPGEYEGVCLNLKDITSVDLEDVILGRMIKEAGMAFRYDRGKKIHKWCST
jgi:hypothetical protein